MKSRSGYLERRTPLRANPVNTLKPARWGVRKAPKQANWREDFMPDWMTATDAPKFSPFEKAWMAFCRELPCSRCGKAPPSDPAHLATGPGQKGTARKVDVRQVVPLCRPCHRWIDGHAGKPPTAEERRELGRQYIAAMQELTTPGDSFDDALALQAAGLGTIEGNAAGLWVWRPIGREAA